MMQAGVLSWVGVVRDITQRKQSEEELRQLSRRIIEAQETERQRVARDLHDSVNQLIASAKMRLRTVADGAAPLRPATREILSRCSDLLVQALEENGRIARNLRPSDLDHLGLAAACRNFCGNFLNRTGLVVKCTIERHNRLPAPVELNPFRIVQEALANVEKHARARRIRLRLAFSDGEVDLRIQDDGRGFHARAAGDSRRVSRGIGLTNMSERAASLNGTCEVESAPTRGTTVVVRIPRPNARRRGAR